jgi:hypothetical protein
VVTAALIVLIENGLTLMHMPRLLTNTEFWQRRLERVTEPPVVEFFHDRYDRWEKEAPLMRESTLNKRWTASASNLHTPHRGPRCPIAVCTTTVRNPVPSSIRFTFNISDGRGRRSPCRRKVGK